MARYGSQVRSGYSGGQERDEEGRFVSEGRSCSRSRDEDDDYGSQSRSRSSGRSQGRGYGGWFGDPEGHAEAGRHSHDND